MSRARETYMMNDQKRCEWSFRVSRRLMRTTKMILRDGDGGQQIDRVHASERDGDDDLAIAFLICE
jgi:hypothetical protein